MRYRILLAAAYLYLAVTNVIWIANDTRPPFWDMAGHESSAIHVYNAFGRSGLRALTEISSEHLTGAYPPLYHTVIAAFWGVLGKSVSVARLANLLALTILFFGTYGIGRHVLGPYTSAIAATLACFYPYMLWLSRETLIDYWLAAMVTLAMWTLLKTNAFKDRRWSVGFGFIAGLGMLTKWTFPFFVILPAIWFARRNLKNALLALSIAVALTAYWYLPSIPVLREFLKINTAGAVFEGDPNRFSVEAFVFYLRALEGYQLFLPLFATFIAGLVLVWKRGDERWIPLVLWILGGWLGLMLFQNKDPRYSAPLLPAVALISALVFIRRHALTYALFAFLVFQHYLVSFGIQALPDSIVLMRGTESQLSWHWNLYTQSYFGLWGPPAREDWKIEHVLDEVARDSGNAGVRLGIVPDIPRFDSQAFQFYVDLRNAPVRLNRIQMLSEQAITANDYLLVAKNDQEHAASFAPDKRVGDFIITHPERFQMTESFPLPNGDVISMFKVQTP
jgi:4-amino-4-deoxy-L-arabinose transferase-like glycosyltransferase